MVDSQAFKKQIICTVTNDLTYDQRMIRICSSLANAGYSVLLVGRHKPDSVALQAQPFQQKRLPCWFQKGKLFYLEYNLRLLLFLLFAKADILYAVDLDTIVPNFLVSRLRHKICVFDAHEYYTQTPEVVRRPAIQQIWTWVANCTIPHLRYGITVGPALATIFQQQYGIPFTTIRNVPFRQTVAVAKTSKPENVLLYQGALNEGRGLEPLIAAMQYLPHATLWLAGEGDLSEDLRNLAQRLQLEEQVKFLGYLLPDALKTITRQATIGFNLLENKGLSYYYSLANKAFDYVQAGIPSIHSDFPEYRNLNAEWEVFVLLPDLKVKTIVKTVERLLNDQNHYLQLAENCQQAAQDWHWEGEEKRLLHLFDTICRENALS